jgi:Tol biopolymer transport system component
MNYSFIKLFIIAFITLTTSGICKDFPKLHGEYLGQKVPDSIPVLFAPGIVSKEGRYEYGLAVSPDGNEIYFTASRPGPGLMVSRKINDNWTEPKKANLRNNDSWQFEAFYTVDGKQIYFSSHPGDLKARIWYIEKDSIGWSEAKLLDSPINSNDVFWATFTTDGTMYYTNINESKIYRSKLKNGKYMNSNDIGFTSVAHPSIAPDESFMLLNNSDGDILISFHQENDSWSEPILLGNKINTSFLETCPSLSPDGKYIFFSRYDDLENKSNIYWVSSAIIESLILQK